MLGDFALKPSSAGFVIAPPETLTLGPWNEQGQPMYAAGMAYRQKFDISQPQGRYRVRLPKWYGSVAKVLVNGKLSGYITHQPWQCDVTKEIVPGINTIEVVVIGTLKNTAAAAPRRSGTWPGLARHVHESAGTWPTTGTRIQHGWLRSLRAVRAGAKCCHRIALKEEARTT